ncbi:hypothetical protein VPH35_095606 [Triticum aestivum]
MGGTTVLPPSLLLPRRGAADLHSCSSRVRVNPALMANPSAANRPKRSVSVPDDRQPPAKRARGACSGGELHAAVAAKISSSSVPGPCSGEDPKSPTCRCPSVIKNPLVESPESATQTKHPVSMRELIEKARLAGRRRDIERCKAEARRKVEQMVDTVQFNDPWMDHSDVAKSPEELLRARQEAWCAQAQLIAMARRRAEAEPFFVQPCWW